jgi:hypothetical protein
LIGRQPRARLARDFAAVLGATLSALALPTIAAILCLYAVALGAIPLLHLPTFTLLPLSDLTFLPARRAVTGCVTAFAALHGLAVRPLTTLNALARTINPALGAIRTRRFALHPRLRPLHARLGPAASLTAAAGPGIRARCRPLRCSPFLSSATFAFFFLLLCEAYGGSAE